MKIDRLDWDVISEPFDRLADLPADQREAEIDRLALSTRHRQQVLELLAQHDRADSLGLDTGAPERLGLRDVDEHDQPPVQPDWQGQRLGPWQVDEVIGRGGMSVVYRGHRADGQFDKEVAIKVLNRAHLVGDAQRLREETRILARLEHPGIARLIDSGASAAGHGYLVMELISGQALDDFCTERALATGERVKLILAAARALEYAHQRQVVHCDVKPANLLVRDDGRLCVVDFGIAAMIQRREDAGRHLYCSPAFTAPERLGGAPPDTSHDIYSLGAVLKQSVEAFGNRDLAAICDRATSAEASARYGSMTGLRSDLEAWTQKRPVEARGGGRSYLLRRWLQRHAMVAALGSLLIASLIAGTAVAMWQASEARSEAARALAARDFLIGIFESADPALMQGEDPPASELLRRGAGQVRSAMVSQPRLLAELLHVIGRIQLERGLNADAASSLDSTLSMPVTAKMPHLHSEALSDRGMVAYNQGDATAAVALIEQGRAIALHQGAESARLDRLEVRLADILIDAGRAGEALTLVDSLLERLQAESTDEPSRLYIEALRVRGAALQNIDRLSEAGSVLENALARQVEVDKHGIQRALIENDLGIVYWYQGNYGEAARVLERSLEHKRRIFGPDHQQTLSGLSNLASVQLMAGEYRGAEAAWLESLQVLERIHAGPHPEIAYTRGMLAWSAYRQDDHAGALARVETALEHRRALKDTDHSTATAWLVPLHGLILLESNRSGALQALQAFADDCLDLAGQTELGQKICLARKLLETDEASAPCPPRSVPAADGSVIEGLPLRWQMTHALIEARCLRRDELPAWPAGAGQPPPWLKSRLANRG